MRRATKTLARLHPISLHRPRAWNVLSIVSLWWLLSACGPQNLIGSAGGFWNTVRTPPRQTLIVVNPTPEMVSVPDNCTALPEDMILRVVPITSTRVRIEAEGLQPGESIKVELENDVPDWTHAANFMTFEPSSPIGEDGTFIYERGHLEPLPEIPSYRWIVRVFHARGVACESVELQP